MNMDVLVRIGQSVCDKCQLARVVGVIKGRPLFFCSLNVNVRRALLFFSSLLFRRADFGASSRVISCC